MHQLKAHPIEQIESTQNKSQKETPVIYNGIYYDNFPPPLKLTKAMKYSHAISFVKNGEIRFGHLETYRKWENQTLGDSSDGYGTFVVDETPLHRGTTNHVYAFCMSLPSITKNRLGVIATAGDYDCVIAIDNSLLFFEKIKGALLKISDKFTLHCSHISYNKGKTVNMDTYKSQDFDFNLFQKSNHFSEDKEYRFVIKDVYVKAIFSPFMQLELGDCSDIVTIAPLEIGVSA